MKVLISILATALVASAGAVTAGAAVPSAPADQATPTVRQFEGTVVSVNRANRTFRLRDTERGTVRIRVTSRTRFERINGFRGLRTGMRAIEATVRRSNGTWVAREVERSGGGGVHGGSDDDRDDDSRGRGRGSDD
jgi:hypothetical protein